MNAVFRAQLTFQMLTLLQKYLSLFDVDVITYPCPNFDAGLVDLGW